MPSPNFKAAGNVPPSRFVAVATVSDNAVVLASANERLIGIAQEGGREPPLPSVSTIYAGQDTDNMHVYGLSEECLLELGDAVAKGDRLKADSVGRGVPIATSGTTLQNVGAIAFSTGTTGDKIRVQVVLMPERPAIS